MCSLCAATPTYKAECIYGEADSATLQTGADPIIYADLPGGNSTGATVNVGGTYNGTYETLGDLDWIKVNLVAGQTYTIAINGAPSSPGLDPYLTVWAPGSTSPASGTIVVENDDGGPGLFSLASFTASVTGTYYIESWDAYNLGGNYVVSVQATVPPPLFTIAQIADQLVNGYWNSTGSTWRHFNVGGDNTLTFNLTALDPTYADMARRALQTWSDITGIVFSETAGAAEITFTDNGTGSAYSTSSTAGNTILSSIVNISLDWLTSEGNEYTFQTFIHEIGHALGLGHAGNYNGSATFGTDNHYQNDSWQATVMSYFSQTDNTFVDASLAYNLTPMLADIAAIQLLYGNPNTTRTGDSVYGYASNVGADLDFDTMIAGGNHFTFTIIDDGGLDQIDLRQSTHDNTVNLNPGTISSILGLVGNMSIDANTFIEYAFGGSGIDNFTGNAANNILSGGAGADILAGGDGADVLIGGLGADTLTGGALGDWFIFSATEANTGDTVTDYTSFDMAYFGNAATAPVFAVSGADVLVNDVRFTGAAAGNITVIGQNAAQLLSTVNGVTMQMLIDAGVAEVAALGAFSTFTFDADNNENWRTSENRYLAGSGLLDSTFTIYDAGQPHYASLLDYDQGGSEYWTTQEVVYSAAEIVDYSMIIYDDPNPFYGQKFDYDQAGNQTWTTQTTFYSSQDVVDFVVTDFDAGQPFQSTKVDYDDLNSMTWTTQTTYYSGPNIADYMITLYDPGQPFVSIKADYDQAGNQLWTTLTTYYSATNVVDYTYTLYDAGQPNFAQKIDYDQVANQTWITQTTYYSADTIINYMVTTFDAGQLYASNVTDLDQAGAGTWAKTSVNYQPGNVVDNSITYYDAGQPFFAVFTDYDQAGNQAWTTQQSYYSALGVVDFNVVTYDAGQPYQSTRIDYDQAGNQTWSVTNIYYTAPNVIDLTYVYYDVGQPSYMLKTDYDQASNQTWTFIQTLYSASNVIDSITTRYDAGQPYFQNVLDYDQANASNWARMSVNYAAAGIIDNEFTYYDALQPLYGKFVDYDQNNQFAWNQHVIEYDTIGHVSADYYI